MNDDFRFRGEKCDLSDMFPEMKMGTALEREASGVRPRPHDRPRAIDSLGDAIVHLNWEARIYNVRG